MTLEMNVLIYSVMLGIVHILLASHSASLQRGYRWTASARDGSTGPLIGVAGRLDRALRNFLETFPFFAAVVLAAHALDRHGALTIWGAQLYLWGRIGFLVLYAAGVPIVRSLLWNAATIGIICIAVALLRSG